jgi:hypothetical protein
MSERKSKGVRTSLDLTAEESREIDLLSSTLGQGRKVTLMVAVRYLAACLAHPDLAALGRVIRQGGDQPEEI